MQGALKSLLYASMSLAVAAHAHAAEPLKLKLMAPIYVDGKGAAIKQPESVSCRGSVLIVADTGNGRILRYTIAGENWTPGGEFVLPQVPYPIRVEASSKGEIYVLDGKSRRIGRVSANGEFLSFVAPGADVQGTVVPRSIRVDRNDNLYILDVYSERIIVLDPSGKTMRNIPFPKGYDFFSDLSVDAGGNILLLDSVGKRVYRATSNTSEIAPLSGSMKEEAYFPVSIATDAQRRIYLVDQNGSGIVILGPDGSFRGRRLSMGWKDGMLRYPTQMCITENGSVFIADRGNNRVDSFLITE